MARPVRISGVRSLRRVLRKMPDDVRGPMQGEVAAAAEDVSSTMASLAPVRTGELRDSIETKFARDRMSARVGPGARRRRTFRRVGWRALFAEFGTRHHPAQPFIGEALERNEARIRRGMSKAVADTLRRISLRAQR